MSPIHWDKDLRKDLSEQSADGAWDKLRIAANNEFAPGVVTVHASREAKYEHVHSPGQDGGTLNYLGWKACDVRMTLTIWTEAHLRDLESLLKFIGPVGSAPPRPIAVEHPALSLLGIKSVFFTRIGALKPGKVKGTMEMDLHASELKPGRRVRGAAKMKPAPGRPNLSQNTTALDDGAAKKAATDRSDPAKGTDP